MKKTLLFLSMSCACIGVYAQDVLDYKVLDTATLKCHYNYEYQENSNNVNSLRSSDMILLVSDKKQSSFKPYRKFVFDSTGIARKEYPSFEEMSILRDRFVYGGMLAQFTVLKDIPQNKTTLLIGFSGTNFFIEDKLNEIEWKLEKEEKKIANYKCQKATCHFGGRDYIAWYTMEVPISEGPYKFSGLPGLIVKIEDTKGEHRFELTSLEQVDDFHNPICYGRRRYVKGKVKDFLKAYSTYRNGGIGGLSQNGVSVKFRSAHPQINKRMRAKNNFIEKE